MQLLLSLPDIGAIEAEQLLFRNVCGVPLLIRVIATAARCGGTEVLLLHPKSLPESWLRAGLDSALLSSIPIRTVALDKAFDPDHPSDWRAIESCLEPKFLWLPWNLVVDKKSLSHLIAASRSPSSGVRFGWAEGASVAGQQGGHVSQDPIAETPTVCIKEDLLKLGRGSSEPITGTGGGLRRYLADSSLQVPFVPHLPGILVRSSKTALQAEREVVRRSGKDSDGIYSRFNRWLSRPAVRWLSKTPVTPNMVTFGGLLVAFLSAYEFAQGHWGAYVLGSLLYFVSVLFDEIDGMLARVTFKDSAFGTWLESLVDYASYVLLFLGMTVGLYREDGRLWLAVGGVVLLGALTSFFVLSKQRKLATDPEKPQEYRTRLHHRLEADRGNIVSWSARRVEFLIRKPAFCHYVILFSALGGLKVLFLLAAFSANVVWLMALYFNRFFRAQSSDRQPLKVAGDI